jgi:hypothetical protein
VGGARPSHPDDHRHSCRSLKTAEKRSQLETEGSPWPTCECHSQPNLWNGDSRVVAGGYFRCRVDFLEYQNSRREARRQSDLCIYCGAPADTETRCRECADRNADLMATPQQSFKHLFAQARYRRRLKSEKGFRPSGVGLAAFAAWTRKDRG